MRGEGLKNRVKEKGERVVGRLNGLADRHRILDSMRSVALDFKKKDLSRQSVYFAYYAFIAVFPLILIISSVIGFIFDASPEMRSSIARSVYDLFPNFEEVFEGIIELMETGRYIALILGLVVFLYTGVKAAEVIADVFDDVWGAGKRPYLKRKAAALWILFAFGALTVLDAIIHFVSPTLLPWLSSERGAGASLGAFFAGMLLGMLIGFLMYFIIYRFVPARKPTVAAAAKGAILMAVVTYVVDYVFGFYFELVYDARFLYGALGVLLGILIWLYVVAATTFAGALYVWRLSGEPDLGAEEDHDSTGVVTEQGGNFGQG